MSGSGQQQGGGGIVLDSVSKPGSGITMTNDELLSVIALLPDGDLKTRLTALLD